MSIEPEKPNRSQVSHDASDTIPISAEQFDALEKAEERPNQMTNKQAAEILKRLQAELFKDELLLPSENEAFYVAIKALEDDWVSVEERLPDDGQRVEFWSCYSRRVSLNEYIGESAKTLVSLGFTHWRHLPKGPK